MLRFLSVISLVSLLSCSGSRDLQRTSFSLEARKQHAQILEANYARFPEKFRPGSPMSHEFRHAHFRLALYAREFSRGNAVYFELHTDRIDELSVTIDKKKQKLVSTTYGARGMYGISAWKNPDTLKINVGIDGKSESYTVPLQKKEYPVYRSSMNLGKYSNVRHTTSAKTKKKIAEDRKKKLKAWSSKEPDRLTEELYHPRDEHKITSPFFATRLKQRYRIVNGKRKYLKSRRSVHRGLDLKAFPGTPIFAIAAGKVVLADHLFYEGKIVLIDHGNKIYSGYMHMSKLLVAEGDIIKAGTEIGEAGATGSVTGAHLHSFLTINGAPVDPLSLVVLPVNNGQKNDQ